MPEVHKLEAHRAELIQVHDHCPERPYVELMVPEDAAVVLSVEFQSVSRDQGWADDRSASYTWFAAAVERPSGRSDLRNITVLVNNSGGPEFLEYNARWTHDSGARRRTWVQALRRGDVIQLIPRAKYLAWVNLVREARISIEYTTREADATLGLENLSLMSGYATRLRKGEKEIRLLRVLPATSVDDKLELSWMLANLNEDVKFCALSYVWGDASDTVEMQITDPGGWRTDGFHVGRTVESVLRRLRLSDGVLKIWIDAVCVNQADLEERSQQVSLMRDIYSRAEKVHIWLGDEEKSAVGTTLRLIRNIHNFNTRSCPGGEACSCSGTRHSIELDAMDERTKDKRTSYRTMNEIFVASSAHFTSDEVDWAGGYNNIQLKVLMSALFSQPWFSRVWVIQEATLAQQAFVHYATDTITWEEVIQVNDWLEDPAWMLEMQHVQSQTLMIPIWKRLRVAHLESKKSSSGASPGLPKILDLFLDAHDLRATDSRDKIFALLTFGKETSNLYSLDDLIQPNYDKSETRVFADFTRWWIKTHKSLAILSAIHSQTGRTWRKTSCDAHQDPPEPRAPTWAVQKGGKSRWAKASLQAQFEEFNASANRRPNPALTNSKYPFLLRLQGRRISRIAAIGHIPMELLFPYHQNMEDRDDMPAVIDKILDPCGYTGFWSVKTIASDRENTAERGRKEYADHLSAHWRYFPGTELVSLLPSDPGETNWSLTDQLPTCFERAFFVTEDGQSGLCPWAAREGDVVTILDGGEVPYLLRNTWSADHEDFDAFEFVGECYVEGIMYGEFTKDITEIFSIV